MMKHSFLEAPEGEEMRTHDNINDIMKQKVREKSRECYNHKPQHFSEQPSPEQIRNATEEPPWDGQLKNYCKASTSYTRTKFLS